MQLLTDNFSLDDISLSVLSNACHKITENLDEIYLNENVDSQMKTARQRKKT